MAEWLGNQATNQNQVAGSIPGRAVDVVFLGKAGICLGGMSLYLL